MGEIINKTNNIPKPIALYYLLLAKTERKPLWYVGLTNNPIHILNSHNVDINDKKSYYFFKTVVSVIKETKSLMKQNEVFIFNDNNDSYSENDDKAYIYLYKVIVGKTDEAGKTKVLESVESRESVVSNAFTKENQVCNSKIKENITNFQKCIDNFPWSRFGTTYETSAKCLKDEYAKILNGNAELSTYKYIINRIEHQETLYRITPWGLKFYIHLLKEEKSDKSILLQNIQTLFEAANYNCQVNIAKKYKPTKGNLAKYEQIKLKLFDDEFDGTMDTEYLKIFKSIERNFMQICIMDYIQLKMQMFEKFVKSIDKNISESAILLINAINSPKQYKFGE